jgi:hypothetical protein
VQKCIGIFGEQRAPFGMDDTKIGQAQVLGEFALIGQCLGKQHVCVDEDDRRGAVDPRHHVQQHRRIGTETRHHRDPPQRTRQRMRQCRLGRLPREAQVQKRKVRAIG